MIDLHTHILPKMDDGADSSQMSVDMLRMQRTQRVDTVVLTPHFYRDSEDPSEFLHRRNQSARRLKERLLELPPEQQAQLPRLCLGAEVAWVPHMAPWPELPRLCRGSSSYLLLELPFYPWHNSMIRQIYDLMSHTGSIPVIAHLVRYLKLQPQSAIAEILSLGVPIQLSASGMLRLWSRQVIRRLLRSGGPFLLASDCHNTTTRPPNLGDAMTVVEQKLGQEAARQLHRQSQSIGKQVWRSPQ